LILKNINEHRDWQIKCRDFATGYDESKKYLLTTTTPKELENERLLFELKEYESELPTKRAQFENYFNNHKRKLSERELELANKTAESIFTDYQKVIITDISLLTFILLSMFPLSLF
jgi:hypothetical protein